MVFQTTPCNVDRSIEIIHKGTCAEVGTLQFLQIGHCNVEYITAMPSVNSDARKYYVQHLHLSLTFYITKLVFIMLCQEEVIINYIVTCMC